MGPCVGEDERDRTRGPGSRDGGSGILWSVFETLIFWNSAETSSLNVANLPMMSAWFARIRSSML